MPSLERFFPPIARFFDTNIKSLPNARLYFFKANSTTLKATFKDKVGDIAHANPVEADASGYFPPIFLSGLYRVELRDSSNITQPGFPVDNVGQDSAIVPFAPWSEIVTYQEDDVVTSPDGFWFRSKVDSNIGNDPDTNPTEWELIVIPIAANFTSSVPWATWSDSGTQLSLDIDIDGLSEDLQLSILLTSEDDLHALPDLGGEGYVAKYYWSSSSVPSNSPLGVGASGFAVRRWVSSSQEAMMVFAAGTNRQFSAQKTTVWGDWDLIVRGDRTITAGDGLSGGGDLSEDRTLSVDPTVARVETARIELGGDFNAGSFVRCVKIGNVVTITSDGSLSHVSSGAPDSGVSAIPSAYRPGTSAVNIVYSTSSLAVRQVVVATDGTISATYRDWNGSISNFPSTGGPFTITYVQNTT